MPEDVGNLVWNWLSPDLVTVQNSNSKTIICKFCGTHLLSEGLSTLVQKDICLPVEESFQNASVHGDADAARSKWFWVIDDMWKFENIAFTHSVSGADGVFSKYLICGSCNHGVLGLQRVGEKDIYISHDRIAYKH